MRMTIMPALAVISILSSCKSEIIQDLKPIPEETEVPLPAAEVAPTSEANSVFNPEAPAAAATLLSADANQLKGTLVKVSWPEGAFAAGYISLEYVTKVSPPSPAQTVLGSWLLSISNSEGAPMTAAKNCSVELSAQLPPGTDAKSVQVLFLGGDGLTKVISPIEIFEQEIPLQVKFSSLLKSGTYSLVVSPLAAVAGNTTAVATFSGNLATILLVPAGLTYSANPVTYATGVGIINNTPLSSGGAVATYSVFPSLPAGLILNATTGAITGIPTTVTATANYTITATNAAGNTTLSLNIAVNLGAPSGLTYSSNPAVYGTNAPITQNAPTSSGGSVASYGVSPPLPVGLTLNTTTGIISGTPTTATSAADYTVTATNAAGYTTAEVNIAVTVGRLTVRTETSAPTFLTTGMEPSGKILATWVANGDIEWSQYDANASNNGTRINQWTVDQGNIDLPSRGAGYPTIASSNTGQFMVAWDQRDPGPNLYARQFNKDSVSFSASALLIESLAGWQVTPQLAYTATATNPNAVAIFKGSDGASYRLRANIFNGSTGTWGTHSTIGGDIFEYWLFRAPTGRLHAVAKDVVPPYTFYTCPYDPANSYTFPSSTSFTTGCTSGNTGWRNLSTNAGAYFDMAFKANSNDGVALFQKTDATTRLHIYEMAYVGGNWQAISTNAIDSNTNADASSVKIKTFSDDTYIAVWLQSDGSLTTLWYALRGGGSSDQWSPAARVVNLDNTLSNISDFSLAVDGRSGHKKATVAFLETIQTKESVRAANFDTDTWDEPVLLENDDATAASRIHAFINANGHISTVWIQGNDIRANHYTRSP